MSLNHIRHLAREELRREEERRAIEAEKARLRAQSKLSFWQRLISKLPFTITIERKKT